uniref:(northern house mosquito) hypothetical protein n=1 Tax=Culex pipiens TaxID=7175 RepID=A0A8D8BIL3_CULPI
MPFGKVANFVLASKVTVCLQLCSTFHSQFQTLVPSFFSDVNTNRYPSTTIFDRPLISLITSKFRSSSATLSIRNMRWRPFFAKATLAFVNSTGSGSTLICFGSTTCRGGFFRFLDLFEPFVGSGSTLITSSNDSGSGPGWRTSSLVSSTDTFAPELPMSSKICLLIRLKVVKPSSWVWHDGQINAPKSW